MIAPDRQLARAFTLIEVLVVVSLLGLVFAVAGVGLAQGGQNARWSTATSVVRNADVVARALAQREGRVFIEPVGAGDGLQVRPVDADGPWRTFQLPPSVTLELQHAAISIDARGLSEDYIVTLRQGSETRRITMLGLTGQVQEESP